METSLPRVLIVDESRIARALLVKQLRERFDCREEADGEAAWQVLVLDHSIRLVVCSLSLPVLDGNDLLARVRASKLPRLREMPMLMRFGDDDAALERARALGASDVLSRHADPAQLLQCIDALLEHARRQNQLDDELAQSVRATQTRLHTRQYIEAQAFAAVTKALRSDGEVSVIVLGFDRLDALREEHGLDIAEQLHQRFAAMLASKVRQQDSLGNLADGQLVVVAPGTHSAVCESFANRLREAIRVASIVVHGQRLNLSVSVGVSNIPVDAVVSGGALIELAEARHREAQQAGGNRVVSGQAPGAHEARLTRLDHALALIGGGHGSEVVPHLAALGRQLLPLLQLMERELKLGLPLADIERRLLDRAREVEDAGQD